MNPQDQVGLVRLKVPPASSQDLLATYSRMDVRSLEVAQFATGQQQVQVAPWLSELMMAQSQHPLQSLAPVVEQPQLLPGTLQPIGGYAISMGLQTVPILPQPALDGVIPSPGGMAASVTRGPSQPGFTIDLAGCPSGPHHKTFETKFQYPVIEFLPKEVLDALEKIEVWDQKIEEALFGPARGDWELMGRAFGVDPIMPDVWEDYYNTKDFVDHYFALRQRITDALNQELLREAWAYASMECQNERCVLASGLPPCEPGGVRVKRKRPVGKMYERKEDAPDAAALIWPPGNSALFRGWSRYVLTITFDCVCAS
ncbi:MAG: hypothetical protein HYY18_11535 [Planctomycetes bacterium]|nr:hypothetical protein [Planctomycetota bacterium]